MKNDGRVSDWGAGRAPARSDGDRAVCEHDSM
jgi:hypothetical protein